MPCIVCTLQQGAVSVSMRFGWMYMSRARYRPACNNPTHGSCFWRNVKRPVIGVATIWPCACHLALSMHMHRVTNTSTNL